MSTDSDGAEGGDYFESCRLQAQPGVDGEEARPGHPPGADMSEPGLGSEPVQGLRSLWEHMATLARAAGQPKGEELGSGLLAVWPHVEGLGSQGLRGGPGEGGSEICLL